MRTITQELAYLAVSFSFVGWIETEGSLGKWDHSKARRVELENINLRGYVRWALSVILPPFMPAFEVRDCYYIVDRCKGVPGSLLFSRFYDSGQRAVVQADMPPFVHSTVIGPLSQFQNFYRVFWASLDCLNG